MEPNKEQRGGDTSESVNQNDDVFSRQPEETDIPLDAEGGKETDEGTVEGYYSSPEDKYLSLEQPGVTFTDDSNTTLLNSDDIEDGRQENPDLWESDKKNSRNSEAFNQDEYILNENVDLDEDAFRSISSDDEDREDINTTDG